MWQLGALALLHWDELELLGLHLARLSDLGISLSHQLLAVLQELAVHILSRVLEWDWSLQVWLEVAGGDLLLWLSNRWIIAADVDLIHRLLIQKSGLLLVQNERLLLNIALSWLDLQCLLLVLLHQLIGLMVGLHHLLLHWYLLQLSLCKY